MPQENTEIIIATIISSLLLIFLTCIVIITIVRYKNRQLKNRKEQLLLKQQFDTTLLNTQLEIQEQTLKTISEEIHDNIGQSLSLAKLNLALAEEEQPEYNKVKDSHLLVSKAIQDLRDLSRSLNTEYVSEMGLQQSIVYELEMIAKTGVIKTKLVAEGPIKRIDKQKELILFRIVQETFNNIIKHANATLLDVEIQYHNESILLNIKDDGQGMDLRQLNDNPENNKSLGIRNMHNRAKLIGADFNVSSTLGKGTEIKIHLLNL